MTALLPMTTTNPRALKQRMETARERSKIAREALNRAQRDFRQAKEDQDPVAEEVAFAEVERAHAEVMRAEDLVQRVLQTMAGVQSDFGRTLSTSIEAQETLKGIAASSAPLREYVRIGDYMSVGELCQMTGRALSMAYGALTVPDPGTDLPGQYQGMAPTPQPPRTLLDFFASVPLNERKASWLQRQAGIAQAGVQVPGALKQGANITYDPAEADVETVASWIKTKRQDADDIDGLMADISLTLRYGVRVEIESLLVAAILGATGIAAPDVSGADNPIDAIVTAVSQLRATGVAVNFVSANPIDLGAWSLLKAGPTGQYLFGTPTEPGGVLSGVTFVPAVAMQTGHVLLGDSLIGAKMGIRSGLSVSVGQESDDMLRNILTTLVEARVAPLVYVPSAFSTFVAS